MLLASWSTVYPSLSMYMNAEVELYGFLNGCGVDMFAMALIICEHRTITLFASNCISWVMMISIYINFFLWFDKFHFPVTLWLFAFGIYLHVWITCNFRLSSSRMCHFKMWFEPSSIMRWKKDELNCWIVKQIFGHTKVNLISLLLPSSHCSSIFHADFFLSISYSFN